MPQNSGVTPNVANTVRQQCSGSIASNPRSFAKQRRYTPYRKTPASRLLKDGARISRIPDDDEADNTYLKDLVNKTWRVYHVSALYKFSSQPTSLKFYSKLLATYIKAETVAGQAVETTQEAADSAVISTIPGLAGHSTSSEAISIVLNQQKKRSGASESKFTAVLCEVATAKQVRKHKSFTELPVMLVKGPVALTRHVHSWLERQFDCHISPVTFSPVDLGWMVAIYAGYLKGKSPRPVELLYKVPSEAKGLQRIIFDIDPKDCKALWDSIHAREDDSFTEEEVASFIRSLECHFYHHFAIDLSVSLQ
ncbi:hypothetical protein NP493_55g04005 [Ridgeia piscesae]|uniref:Centromere protein L n=1 Tax=Ridgeia piscesae TaxID=27915 RepID=A0AAD9PAL0_RIDPI|nr:hypothetical protein NP493_55g04005 [Ridgeia piscesae]